MRSDFDPARAEAFAARFLTALDDRARCLALCLMVSIGHRTGLFDAPSGLLPATADDLATRAGLHERHNHRAGTAPDTPRGGCVMKALMRHSFLLAPVLALARLAAAQSPTPQVGAQDSAHAVVVTPGDLAWGPAPAVLPAGAKAVVLDGDPAKPGPFTMRLRFPAGYRIPPHFHPAIEHVTVVQGTFLVGMGERFDDAKLKPLPAGSFVVIPIGMRHFAQARDQAVIQFHGIGPWGLTYVNPADDPRSKRR